MAIGIIEGGEDGISRLQDAVNILQQSPRMLTRVRTLKELGSMLRRSGRRQTARGFLSDALDLAIVMEQVRWHTEREKNW